MPEKPYGRARKGGNIWLASLPPSCGCFNCLPSTYEHTGQPLGVFPDGAALCGASCANSDFKKGTNSCGDDLVYAFPHRSSCMKSLVWYHCEAWINPKGFLRFVDVRELSHTAFFICAPRERIGPASVSRTKRRGAGENPSARGGRGAWAMRA